MSSRRANSNRIRGPQSALTDFLAANNISAAQIRDSYEQRQRNAASAAQQNGDIDASTPTAAVEVEEEEEEQEEEEVEVERVVVETSRAKKRKRVDEKAKAKAKMKAKKSKKSDDEFEDSDEDAILSRSMYKKAKPLPGQLDNCEICNKRFTVTAYSKTGPDGGLVCSPCGRELTSDLKKDEKKPKKAGAGKKRRQAESNRLDGIVSSGPKTLGQLCVEKVADHAIDLEELGDLPEELLSRLSEIFSKRRVLTPRTLRLFLRSDLKTIALNDCAYLEVDDYKQMFAIVPNVTKLVLRNACQFKDAVLEYMMEKAPKISFFQVYAANLITNEMWMKFFESQGPILHTLKLQWLDASFTDEVVAHMVQHCSSLRRLKFKYCRQLTAESLILIGRLKKLEHLSLQVSHLAESDRLVSLIQELGPNLRTLSLEGCTEADDPFLEAVGAQCAKLTKFRLCDVDCISDAAFANLFSKSSSLPPLTYIDISSARDVDNNNPNGSEEAPIGLASAAFKALMAHSGSTLQRLEMASCRHVSHAAFCDVFDGSNTYPELKEFNLSFCNSVDSAVVKGIFACCPKLKKLTAFGCFNIDDVVVPSGIALIGVPKAHDAIEQFGIPGMDRQSAVGIMDNQISAAA